jgi:D-sedoheptulose 7-phosphate isomerase
MALTDPTDVTCAGNDFGYDRIFSRQVEAFGNAGDVLVAISTSGNSPNVILAVEAARKQGLLTSGWLGKDGGKLRGATDIELLVPSPITARVQEAHKVLLHCLCGYVDAAVD